MQGEPVEKGQHLLYPHIIRKNGRIKPYMGCACGTILTKMLQKRSGALTRPRIPKGVGNMYLQTFNSVLCGDIPYAVHFACIRPFSGGQGNMLRRQVWGLGHQLAEIFSVRHRQCHACRTFSLSEGIHERGTLLLNVPAVDFKPDNIFTSRFYYFRQVFRRLLQLLR